mgnify:CR=1 FL=1
MNAKPVAWLCAKCGNTSECEGVTVGDNWCNSCAACDTMRPLFDQSAMDAAVDAERERWIAKAGMAYTDAHAIFNDPPSETAQEVRDVIEWHLATMRAYTESP